MNKLSAVLIVKDEASNIADCLLSLQFADEIIVLDTGSSDNTAAIAKELGGNVFFQEKWEGFGLAKQEAVNLAENDWILSVDADERISPELQAEVLAILKAPKYDIYRIKRRSFYLGKEIKHSGWGNDYPKRLFNKNLARFNTKPVHESVESASPRGQIESPLYHYTYSTLNQHLQKINFYTELASQSTNKSVTIFGTIARPIFKFIKSYIIQLGFIDGKAGFVLSYFSAIGIAVKSLKIYANRNIK